MLLKRIRNWLKLIGIYLYRRMNQGANITQINENTIVFDYLTLDNDIILFFINYN